ncbi:MAG: uracil phosphoribosyltransferase [Saccharofermentanales bacterium]|jgi:uracil phosphoribosyltransferase|nr:uracil phosphoribosyltransferase [Bacillota bacterium]NLB08965.1 uracil phosphoribosyltransferase [Clostridiales bacterium]
MEANLPENIIVLDHPLIQHKVGILRNKQTPTKEFRELVSEVAMLIGFEATRELPLEEIEVETPIAPAAVKQLAGNKLALVPILRAGLGMVDGLLSITPNARVGHIGLFRDHDTWQPIDYYCKLPEDIQQRDVFLLDPMVATGGSAAAAISTLKRFGAHKIKLLCIIAAREGLMKVVNAHPDVAIYCAALDETLNENAYIVPGLGDAGDRIFGTK